MRRRVHVLAENNIRCLWVRYQGEVNDLKQLLRLAQNDRSDHQKQREALKKVIAFMTLGIGK